MAVFLRARLAN